ncbi:MAG: CehA/McbA family metallohydrolase [Christensenellaceae bacterium]|jgi:hypothetical protein|nr:CehA/McbA family metallohydrolase [Christensenellaceae bacterium]
MNTQTISFDYFVPKSIEKKYIQIPFEMPKNVESVDVSLTYEGMEASSTPIGEKNVIDIAIISPDKLDVGAAGSAYKTVTIGEAYSSPGYKRVPLVPGTWNILLGAYIIKESGVNCHYDITFHFKYLRQFKGDPHVHSTNSDGKLCYAELIKEAEKRKLDFLIMTDHNYFPTDTLPQTNNLTLIPGVELTNYQGHINYWGVPIPYTGSFSVNTFEEFLKLNDEAGKKNAIRVINHPRCQFCGWKWDVDFPIEGVEVWNGPMRHDNLNAIELWDSQLKNGRKLFATGGADFHDHKILLFARPTTVIYAMSNSPSDILDAFRAGRVSITSSAKSPVLTIMCGDKVAGGTIKLESDTVITVKCEKLKRGQRLLIYDKTGVVYEKTATKTAEFSVTLPVKNVGYMRAEIRYKLNFPMRRFYKLFMKITKSPYINDPLPWFVYSMTSAMFFE